MAKRRRKKKKIYLTGRFFIVITVLVFTVAIVVFAVRFIRGRSSEAGEAGEPTPVPTSTPLPSSTPNPSLPPNVTVVRSESANPNKFGFKTALKVNGRDSSSYKRSPAISFGRDSDYTKVPGILTFGGNNYRNSFTYGMPSITDRRLKEAWKVNLGSIGSWSGTGWTGQPLIVHWPDSVLPVLGVENAFKEQEGGLTEVIYPAMDGNIYFMELFSGKQTRTPISTGIVQKGTSCLDPNGYPVLYVGQGIPVTNDQKNDAAYIRVYNLITNEEMHRFGGYDYFGKRVWQAYDGSPIITNDTLIYGGENGVLYTCKLNTTFDAETGTVSINPDGIVKMNYLGDGYSRIDGVGSRWLGIESSVAAFRNYLYFTDNGGRLQCVDVNSMQLKFVVDVKDEADSSVVIDEAYSDNTIFLYSATQVRSADKTLGSDLGYCHIRKINGLTGTVIWEKSQLCSIGDSANSGGCLATPHVGRGPISHLVICSYSLAAITGQSHPLTEATPSPDPASSEEPIPAQDEAASQNLNYSIGGRIVAYDKTTGQEIWTVEQSDDYWSSPVVVYDQNGTKAYLLQCDRGGKLTMYDASTGSQLNTLDLGSRIDSTPAVFGNMLVVGTRGKGGNNQPAKISCVQIY